MKTDFNFEKVNFVELGVGRVHWRAGLLVALSRLRVESISVLVSYLSSHIANWMFSQTHERATAIQVVYCVRHCNMKVCKCSLVAGVSSLAADKCGS